jgi:formate-dependent nitrite reductase cytochrome c552 subunit
MGLADSVPVMNAGTKSSIVAVALCALFIALAGAFVLNLFGRPATLPKVPLVDPKFTNTATVRLSAAQQIKAGTDNSLDCYVCHDRKTPPVIKRDASGNIVLPKEHADLVMRHGRNNRNESCFNCHDPENLDTLKTRDGKKYKWEESTKLCASCHGPTYRDWEIGIHGRTSGYWDRSRGPVIRQECASCHHPHSPEFQSIAPAPGPHPLHPKPAAHAETSH